jgi:hypothetical protein
MPIASPGGPVTSKKKRHQPRPAAVPTKAPRSSTSSREWLIRGIAVLAVAVGATMALIGVTPGVAGGWGKLLLVAPGMVIAAGGFIAFVETTSLARSRRIRRR